MKLKILLLVASAVVVGLAVNLAYISNAASYMSNDAKTCMNCHVMGPQYATWQHSAHRENATCNDCHVPHEPFYETYAFKAKDGLKHSTIFTMRTEPQAIKISDEAVSVVQNNCIRCHQELVQNLANRTGFKHDIERNCWECHRETPHGAVRSLSATPNAILPVNESIIPEWLQKKMDKEVK